MVLYDSELVASHFVRLPEREELQPYSEWRDCRELLEVLLYYMEREAHFTGRTQVGLFSELDAPPPDTTLHGGKGGRPAAADNPYLHPAVFSPRQQEERGGEEQEGVDGSSS